LLESTFDRKVFPLTQPYNPNQVAYRGYPAIEGKNIFEPLPTKTTVDFEVINRSKSAKEAKVKHLLYFVLFRY